MRPGTRPPWAELALAVCSLAVGLAIAEVAIRMRLSPHARAALPHVGLGDQDQNRLRWFERRASRHGRDRGDELGFDRPDADLGWSPIPDLARRRVRAGAFDVTIHTNADGLRGEATVPRERPPGRARIAVFGCSQTFGAEVEDGQTYSARLQDLLTDADVLNFGVHGYGTDQMLLRYERDGVPFDPDVVVVGFAYYHIQRNLDDFRFFAKPRFVIDGGELRLTGVPVPTPDVYAASVAPPQPWRLLDRSVLLRWTWQILLQLEALRLYAPTGPAWTTTRALLRRFAAEAQANGARFVLLNIEDDSAQLEPVLAGVAREDGGVFVNAGRTLGDLRGQGKRFRVPGDPHWGPEGHAIIASDLARAICANALVPPASCR